MFEIIKSIEIETAGLSNLLELVKIIEQNHEHIIPKEDSVEKRCYLHELERNNSADRALAQTICDGLERYMGKIFDLISKAYQTR